MLLATKQFTLGDTIQYTVDYREHPGSGPYTIVPPNPVRDGDSITSTTVVSNSSDVTITGAVVKEGHKVFFVLSGGVLNETFTLNIVANDNFGEVLNDQIAFTVVAPGATS